jgi:hypothetical protein
MLLPACTGIGLFELVMASAADGETTTLAEALLLVLLGSPVAAETASVSVSVVPDAAVADTVATNVKFAVVPEVRLAMVQVSVATEHVQPVGPVSVMAVSPVGIVSVNLTVVAVAGPALVTDCV